MEYLEIAATVFVCLLILMALVAGLMLAFTFVVSHSMIQHRKEGDNKDT